MISALKNTFYAVNFFSQWQHIKSIYDQREKSMLKNIGHQNLKILLLPNMTIILGKGMSLI